jgi:hypothetical protein
MSHFVVTGAQAGLTANVVPNRLEINDLIKNQDQFSLYIQALSKLLSVCAHYRTGLLTPKQLNCKIYLRTTRFLTLVLAEYTVSLTNSGRVLVAPPAFQEPGVDIAIITPCFSRLGTGPTWHCMRFEIHHEVSLTLPWY